MTAWPLIPRMFLMIHLSGGIEPPGQVLHRVRQPDPFDRAALVEVDVRVDGEPALGGVVVGILRRDPLGPGEAPDRAGRLELLDHLAHVGEGIEQRLVDRQRLGLELELDVRPFPGVVDRPLGGERLAVDEVFRLT